AAASEAASAAGTAFASETVVTSDGGCGTASEVGMGMGSERVVTSDGGCGVSCVAVELASALKVVAACDIAASMASRLGGSAAGAGVAGGRGGSRARVPCWTSGSLALIRTQMLESGSNRSPHQCRFPNPAPHHLDLAGAGWVPPPQITAPRPTSEHDA